MIPLSLLEVIFMKYDDLLLRQTCLVWQKYSPTTISIQDAEEICQSFLALLYALWDKNSEAK